MKQVFPGEAFPRQPGSAHFSIRHVEGGGAGVAPHVQVLGLKRVRLRGFWMAFNCCASR